MGTWGTGVFDDDVALDLRDIFEDALARGSTPVQAADAALREMGEDAMEDSDDGPVIVFALTSVLLDRGLTRHPLFERARQMLDSGEGLERWEEAEETNLRARREECAKLSARLAAVS